MGPLRETKRGNIYILVMVDSFTGWVELIPIPDKTTDTVARAMFSEWVSRWGLFRELLTDQGREFWG